MIPALPVAEPAPINTRAALPEKPETASKKVARRPAPLERRLVTEPVAVSPSAREISTPQPTTSDLPSEPQSGKPAEAHATGDIPPTGTTSTANVSAARFDADYLRNPAPAYPPLARRLREEGKVVLRVFVTPEGAAGQVELRTSSGFPRLDQAARDAVSRWKFVPARRGDETVGAWVLIPIVFNLND